MLVPDSGPGPLWPGSRQPEPLPATACGDTQGGHTVGRRTRQGGLTLSLCRNPPRTPSGAAAAPRAQPAPPRGARRPTSCAGPGGPRRSPRVPRAPGRAQSPWNKLRVCWSGQSTATVSGDEDGWEEGEGQPREGRRGAGGGAEGGPSQLGVCPPGPQPPGSDAPSRGREASPHPGSSPHGHTGTGQGQVGRGIPVWASWRNPRTPGKHDPEQAHGKPHLAAPPTSPDGRRLCLTLRGPGRAGAGQGGHLLPQLTARQAETGRQTWPAGRAEGGCGVAAGGRERDRGEPGPGPGRLHPCTLHIRPPSPGLSPTRDSQGWRVIDNKKNKN